MAVGILSSAQAGPWREENVPLMDRGVSLHWLFALVADLHDELNEQRQKYFVNTHSLVSQFIKPLTQDVRGPLFALVPPEHRGRPTAFISHTWNSLLVGPQRQQIGTLDAVFEEKKDEFVWIDFVCYNQHAVEHKDISADMLGVIKTIGNLVVAVTPTPLYNRSWCLWELYCADTIGLTPKFRVCHGYRNDKIQSVNALYRSFSGVENARSISVQAEEEIRNAFISRHGSAEKANAAIKAMLERQLGGSWHELQPSEGPLKFSAGPWLADPQGATLRAYDPYWEPGLMDSLIYGGIETVRELFARAGVYIGAQEMITLSLLNESPASLRFVDALINEDIDSIMSVKGVDVNHPLPFRGIQSYEVAPPLHYLMPWAEPRTIDVLLLMGADVNLPWTYPPETKSSAAMERERLVRALLNKEGELPNASWTPLMMAAEFRDLGICQQLIKLGAKAGYADKGTGATALHIAVAVRKSAIVDLLLSAGAPIDAALVNGMTALHIAARVGLCEIVKSLMGGGARRDLRDAQGRSAVELAVAGGHSELVSLLDPEEFTKRQSFFQSEQELRECLAAIQNNDVLTIERALSRGVDFTKSPLGSRGPLFGHAVWKGNLDIVRLLLASGLDANADLGPAPALVLAIEKGHSDVAEALLEAGADVNAEDEDGGTALTWAAQMGNTALATRLLDLHADVAHAKRNGATALTHAADKGNAALVDVLLSRGAPVDAITSGGNTALHFAAFRGHEQIVELLLHHGAARAVRNRDNLTPRDQALREGHNKVAELLL